MIERSALGFGFGLGVMSSGVAVAWAGIADMLCRELHRKSQLLSWRDVRSLNGYRYFVRTFIQSINFFWSFAAARLFDTPTLRQSVAVAKPSLLCPELTRFQQSFDTSLDLIPDRLPHRINVSFGLTFVQRGCLCLTL